MWSLEYVLVTSLCKCDECRKLYNPAMWLNVPDQILR